MSLLIHDHVQNKITICFSLVKHYETIHHLISCLCFAAAQTKKKKIQNVVCVLLFYN